MGNLTGKQRSFIDYYLGEARFNATEAARLAGYSGSDNALGVIGYENLRKPKIRVEIDRKLEEIAMSAAEVLARLGAMARGERPTKRVETAGEHPSTSETFDEESALELLGKYHRLFTDKLEVSGEDGSPILIRLDR